MIKWLSGECVACFFENIMTSSHCLHRRYTMSQQKNSFFVNEHVLNMSCTSPEQWTSPLSLVKQMWKWINQHVMSVGKIKNLSPREDLYLWLPNTYRELIESKAIYYIHIQHVACTASMLSFVCSTGLSRANCSNGQSGHTLRDWMVTKSWTKSWIEFTWGETSAHSKLIFLSIPSWRIVQTLLESIIISFGNSQWISHQNKTNDVYFYPH